MFNFQEIQWPRTFKNIFRAVFFQSPWLSPLMEYFEWFASCLTERQQYCYLNGQNSEKRLVSCGIPQGSCLGPLLFTLYTNDFGSPLQNSHPICMPMTQVWEDAWWRGLLPTFGRLKKWVARCHRLAKTKQVKPKCNEMRIHVLRKQQAIRQDLRNRWS